MLLWVGMMQEVARYGIVPETDAEPIYYYSNITVAEHWLHTTPLVTYLRILLHTVGLSSLDKRGILNQSLLL